MIPRAFCKNFTTYQSFLKDSYAKEKKRSEINKCLAQYAKWEKEEKQMEEFMFFNFRKEAVSTSPYIHLVKWYLYCQTEKLSLRRKCTYLTATPLWHGRYMYLVNVFFTECKGYKVSVKKLFSISDLDCLVVGGLILTIICCHWSFGPLEVANNYWAVTSEKVE